jgi:hypothetical protein
VIPSGYHTQFPVMWQDSEVEEFYLINNTINKQEQMNANSVGEFGKFREHLSQFSILLTRVGQIAYPMHPRGH